MSRRFSNSKGLASAIGASNYNGLASAVGTTTREYLTEDGKKVKETDYYIKFAKTGAATGAGIGYKIAGPPGAVAGFIIGGIAGPED